MSELSDAERAYAAGFFDGEGAVIIEHYKKNRTARKRTNLFSKQRVYFYETINWRLRVSVSQVDPAPLFWLHARYGGSIATRKKSKHSRRDYYNWVLGSLASERFLRDIRPYAIVKQREIDIALAFRALFKPTSKPGLTDDQLQERLRLAEQIRARNRWADSPYMASKKVDLHSVVQDGGEQ